MQFRGGVGEFVSAAYKQPKTSNQPGGESHEACAGPRGREHVGRGLFATALAEQINKKLPGTTATPQATDGGADNLYRSCDQGQHRIVVLVDPDGEDLHPLQPEQTRRIVGQARGLSVALQALQLE
ncbi:hypothetical protein [Candidatus Frankia alpina]|uniref:Uncharacterized protein n=1 Tax=Candidatus Frankia alpina TaxID=2699483 RepID=A0A4S5EQD5_9ACTN|nr:hypothetical protein [Candidatus Frankia alpina]THJ74564.1 hypothetical protein E7Y31_10685 [Candidatus Frankia alpina]